MFNAYLLHRRIKAVKPWPAALAIAAVLLFASFAPGGEPGKLAIIATLFPQYDFARRIAGEKADVSLLLPPGADSHSYEPTPSDMLRIADADLFIHGGQQTEPWALRILAALADSGRVAGVDSSTNIQLIASGGQEENDAEDQSHDSHSHAVDPHYWLDPHLAMLVADTIADAICQADPDNSDLYRNNARLLRDDLEQLDRECAAMAAAAKRKTLVFGGRFAFAYFCQRYGLAHVGVYDSCGPGADPSVKRIIEVVDYVKRNAIPVVYYEEMSTPRIAETIAAESGAVLLMAHSLHNISADETQKNVSYLDLMRQNLDHFKKGLE